MLWVQEKLLVTVLVKCLGNIPFSIPLLLILLYARRRRDVLCYNSKTMLAMVMELHRWIDLIKAECSAQEP